VSGSSCSFFGEKASIDGGMIATFASSSPSQVNASREKM
jgi:hypothetical protein